MLRIKWKNDANVLVVENLVELACGGVTVTTERKGVRYRTILQIDGDVIQKCEVPSEVEAEHIDLAWMEHLASVNANLEGIREVVDRLVQELVNIVSAALALVGIVTAFGLASHNASEVTMESAFCALLGGVPGLVFLRFGRRVTAFAFRRVLSRRLGAISAKLTGRSVQRR